MRHLTEVIGAFLLGALVIQAILTVAAYGRPWAINYPLRCWLLLIALILDFLIWRAVK